MTAIDKDTAYGAIREGTYDFLDERLDGNVRTQEFGQTPVVGALVYAATLEWLTTNRDEIIDAIAKAVASRADK